MKLSIFTTMTEPEKRMDPWKEAIKCYEDYAPASDWIGMNEGWANILYSDFRVHGWAGDSRI